LTATVCDVGPRDGLQLERVVLDAATRAEFVNRLAAAGVPRIEAVSFVHPGLVPQMAGAEDVVGLIERRGETVYAGLVLNERGFDRLLETDLDEAHIVFAATETFNERNQGRTVEQSVAESVAMVERAQARGLRTTITIAVAFGCPFEGRVEPATVLELAARVADAGADEICFADTIGVASPGQVARLVRRGLELGKPVGVHLHDTRNLGIANAYVALEAGASVLDASCGGTGGCPFAPRATGNIATEDLVNMLHNEGMETGIDLDAMIRIAEWLETLLEHPLDGHVYRAGVFEASVP
jgi:hydroxymethylglutaryl-CoA lyase/(R)-citramalyl-CoA lyase